MEMGSIINIAIVLAGVVLFGIFIRQNFSNKENSSQDCDDCSACMSSDICMSRNNTDIESNK
ncbi:MAG: hypothetical protein WDA74_05700 [Spirochaetota bacterium]